MGIPEGKSFYELSSPAWCHGKIGGLGADSGSLKQTASAAEDGLDQDSIACYCLRRRSRSREKLDGRNSGYRLVEDQTPEERLQTGLKFYDKDLAAVRSTDFN